MGRFLRSILKGVLSDREVSILVTSFDVVGDLAILKLPDELLPKKNLIGDTLIKQSKQIKTVLRQVSGFSGEFRTRQLEYLAGEKKFEVIYKEAGCEFRVDLAATYFSPRLGHERTRIAQQVKPGETIINLFGGVGTFAVVIAKTQPLSRIYSIDLNPSAHRLAVENALRNKVADRVVAVYGDSREIVQRNLFQTADRVLMPLPGRSGEFLDVATNSLKPQGGVIHYYTLVKPIAGQDPIILAKEELSRRLQLSHQVEMERILTETGPRIFEVVLDVRVLTGQ